MTSYGKTVRIYLADGTPTGIRHAEVVNWTGQAIVCPRGRVGELAQWPESQRPGVYVLVGEHPEDSRPLAYIGEAENVLDRLRSHIRGKDFWDQVVFFTSKDENLTKAHVRYLEARMVELAKEARRIDLDNSAAPQRPLLSRSARDAMEEFLEPTRILLGALGFLLLESVVRRGGVSAESPAGSVPLSTTPLNFRVPKRGVEAQGYATDDGFVVLVGSVGPVDLLDSLQKGWRELREKYTADGTLEVQGNRVRFTRDVLFRSPSAAASVVCGGVRNGRRGWKDAAGHTLAELEAALALGATPTPPDSSETA